MSSLPKIKKSAVKKLLPKRSANSHKGQNGRVVIVGGSKDFVGAPVLAGLGALRAGADLVHLFVPASCFEAIRAMSPDLIVHKFSGDHLKLEDVDEIVNFAREKADTILIGPGVAARKGSVDAVLRFLSDLPIPTVLDASAIMALKRVEKFPLVQPLVITPHRNEFANLVDREITVSEADSKSVILLRSVSMDLHVNILLKGARDFISSYEGNVEVNETGNAGMTVGGTGDVLAGLVAGLIAQGMEGFDAARCGAYFAGAAGDELYKEHGYGFLASEMAAELGKVMA